MASWSGARSLIQCYADRGRVTRNAIRQMGQRRAIRALTLWLGALSLLGLGVVVFRDPPDRHFGIYEWLANCVAGCLALSAAWAAFDLWKLRRSWRATGLFALASGAVLFGIISVEALRSPTVGVLGVALPSVACALCVASIPLLARSTVVDATSGITTR
jgi:peptidoglycan/LPS O-acetylase OafA/YrhL